MIEKYNGLINNEVLVFSASGIAFAITNQAITLKIVYIWGYLERQQNDWDIEARDMLSIVRSLFGCLLQFPAIFVSTKNLGF